MATNPLQQQLYPLSTEDAKAIPLDVIRPKSLKRVAFEAYGVATALSIPADWVIASFYSDSGCFVEFAASTLPNPLIADTEYANVLFVPPNCVVVSTVEVGTARVISLNNLTAGFLIAQHIQKWAGIALRIKSSSTI